MTDKKSIEPPEGFDITAHLFLPNNKCSARMFYQEYLCPDAKVHIDPNLIVDLSEVADSWDDVVVRDNGVVIIKDVVFKDDVEFEPITDDDTFAGLCRECGGHVSNDKMLHYPDCPYYKPE